MFHYPVEKTQRAARQRQKFALWSLGVFFAGLVLTVLLYQTRLAEERQAAQAHFYQQAQQIQKLFIAELNLQAERLALLQNFVSSSNPINRQKFQKLVETFLKKGAAVKAVAWLPKIRVDDKPAFEFYQQSQGFLQYKIFEKAQQDFLVEGIADKHLFPVAYIEPLQTNEHFIGFNLSERSRPLAYQTAMESAIQNRVLMVDVGLPDEKQDFFRKLVFFLPLWQSEKRVQLSGFISLAIDANEFLAEVIEKYQLPKMIHYQLLSSEGTDTLGRYLMKPVKSLHTESYFSRMQPKMGDLDLQLEVDLLALNPDSHYAEMVEKRSFISQGVTVSLLLSILLFFLLNSRFNKGLLQSNLSEQKAIYEKLVQNSPEGYVLLEDGNIRDFNAAALNNLSLMQLHTLSGKAFDDFDPFYQPDGQFSKQKKRQLIERCHEKGSVRFEWLFKRPDSSVFWADVFMTSFVLERQTLLHVAWRDISEQKQLQTEFMTAKEAAEAANEAKSDFLGNVSHELRTPIHGILSYAHLGQTRIGKVSEEKLQRYFAHIYESGERLQTFLNNLLDLVKYGAKSMQLEFSGFTFSALVEEVLIAEAARLEEKQLKVLWHSLPGQESMLEADRERMRQVLLNLISNAIKFSPPQSQILLHAEKMQVVEQSEQVSEVLFFSIEDQGQGIPQHELERIFSRFEQSSLQKTGTAGTGLGLAICREIIHAHHGKIWAENAEEKGARFCFSVPLISEESSSASEENG